jgi:hypothetical protein
MTPAPSMGTMVSRLLAHWRRAPAPVKREGAEWYRRARVVAYYQAQRHSQSLATCAGVIAALSPRLSWTRNVRAADEVLAGSERPAGVFRASVRKALAILRGASPLAVLSGPKVRAFYRALMGDEGAAVVDVWVARALGWTRELTEGAYRIVERALVLAAARARCSVATLQATVWIAVRGRA